MKWSPTALLDSKGCTRKFQKRWIENAPVEIYIPEFEEGTKIHTQIQAFLKTGNDMYISEFNDALKKGLKSLKDKGQIETELWLEDELLKGSADIVIENENKWTLIDIKSRYDSTINEDLEVQLYCYLYLIQQRKEKPQAEIGVIAVHNQFTPFSFKHAELIRIDELKEYVLHQIECAERRLKHKRINISECRYCPYILSCTEVPDKPATIHDIARKYLQLQALLKQYEEQLKSYVELTGENIIVDDIEIGMHIKNITKINSQELFEIAKQYDLNFTELFKPDIVAVKKKAKEIPDLANCISIEQEYYFTAKRSK